jgi:DNA-binding SARP family transcriptional activator
MLGTSKHSNQFRGIALAHDIELRLLGPVEAWAGGRQLDIGPRKQRLVLAVLALEPHRVVQVERLIGLLWQESPPVTARGVIQVCISRLRRTLADAGPGTRQTTLVRHPGGYCLHTDPERVDAHRFRTMAAQAATCSDDEAVALLRQALALWRGEALLGTGSSAVRSGLTHGLTEARLGALERCLDAELRLGHHRTVLDELVALVHEYPEREPFTAQLMLALYRSGQPSRALKVYRHTRRRLVEAFGVEPGIELQKLHQAMLQTSPSLDLPTRLPVTSLA